MKEKCTELRDLRGYDGPIDRILPYHYFMHVYMHLRGAWRRVLYDWTRRAPCDASVTVSPEQTIAGQGVTITLKVTVGKTPLSSGGRMAVYFPIYYGGDAWRGAPMVFQGPDGLVGYGARIVARSEKTDVVWQTVVYSTGSVFTCVEATLMEGELRQGDTVDIVIGDPVCKLPIVSEHAKSFPLRVAVDAAGNGEYRPILPSPVVRNVGAAAGRLRVFAPATPRSGDPFAVRVVAADLQNHNASHHYAGRIRLETTAGAPLGGPNEIELPESAHGTLRVEGVRVDGTAPCRLLAYDRDNALMGRSNPIWPAAAPAGLACYYGEIHSHTELSDGGGLPADSLRWARDVEGLDFSALADHFEDGQGYNYTLEDKWRITQEVIARFNDPGRFVTLLGYEIGTVERHRNVYFSDGEGRMIVEGPGGETVTMANVFEKLAGTDYLLIPHAPRFHGINWHRPHNPDRQRLVEIFSYWGDSEEGGPLSVRHALDLGYRFGFTGGTDSHCAEAGNPDIGGITGVWAAELTRQAIFESLRARRTFATNGPRMILNFRAGDTPMGGEGFLDPGAPVRLQLWAAAHEPILRIEIVRNGIVAHTVEGQGEDMLLEWEDPTPLRDNLPSRELTDTHYAYYYARITTVHGGRGWASPVFLGEALA